MDVDSLVELIKADMERDGSYDRYPIRFLSMRYEAGVSNVLIKIQQNIKDIELFDIKDLLPHEDAWITVDRLRKAIYSLNAKKSFIVVGFSEYARFLSQAEFISLLISLIELENQDGNQKRRLYIPCFALYSQIKKTIMVYHRRIDVYNPLLNDTDVEDLPRIYFIDKALNVNFHTNEVVNSAEWFGMWRNPDIDTTKPILCSSKTLAYFYYEASPD
ncbi:MAG: BREX-4 system phosphatase PglZ, partial [Bacteroides sp.]|nr:BREX-4 system phosphatase PglZ [Bacteroides sp.]